MKEEERTRPIKALWQKYRARVLVWFALGTLLYLGITAAENLSAPPRLSLVAVNVRLSQAGTEALRQRYAEQTEAAGSKGTLLMAEAHLEAFETRQDLDTNYMALQALLSLHGNQELDLLLMDQTAMENFLRQGIYLDLRKLFGEEELLALGEAAVWGRHRDEEEARPLVLDVTELPFIREHGIGSGKVYLAFADNTSQLQACRISWEIMATWEDPK